MKEGIHLFADGSSLGNPGPGGYGVLILNTKAMEIIELGGGKKLTTNNEMELMALVAGLSLAAFAELPIYCYLDSQYVLNGVTNWMFGWHDAGWTKKDKEPIKNLELWKKLHDMIGPLRELGLIHYIHVYGHTGQTGNERVDVIAKSYGQGEPESLRRGFFHNYNIDATKIIPERTEEYEWQPRTKAKSVIIDGKAVRVGGAKKGTARYVAKIGNEVRDFEKWFDCEIWVKGKPAKFKKYFSHDEKVTILKDWESGPVYKKKKE